MSQLGPSRRHGPPEPDDPQWCRPRRVLGQERGAQALEGGILTDCPRSRDRDRRHAAQRHRRDGRCRPARLPRRLAGRRARHAVRPKASACRSSRLARAGAPSRTRSAARLRAWPSDTLTGGRGSTPGSTSRPMTASTGPGRSPRPPSSGTGSTPPPPAAVAAVAWRTRRPPPPPAGRCSRRRRVTNTTAACTREPHAVPRAGPATRLRPGRFFCVRPRSRRLSPPSPHPCPVNGCDAVGRAPR